MAFAPFPCIISSFLLITRLITTSIPLSFSSYLKGILNLPREPPPESAGFPEVGCRSEHAAPRILKKNYVLYKLLASVA